jgi:hypothetical protein
MRALAWTIVAIAMTSAAVPARAQTYDPNYPVCIQVYTRGANYISCGFTSIAQCQMSASGRAAQCLVNPYYAGAYQPYPAPVHRRRKHHVS